MIALLRALVTVDVFYYRPQSLLLQEFLWQTDDVVPEVPRVHEFLDHWRRNIEATIHSVEVAYAHAGKYRHVDIMRYL